MGLFRLGFSPISHYFVELQQFYLTSHLTWCQSDSCQPCLGKSQGQKVTFVLCFSPHTRTPLPSALALRTCLCSLSNTCKHRICFLYIFGAFFKLSCSYLSITSVSPLACFLKQCFHERRVLPFLLSLQYWNNVYLFFSLCMGCPPTLVHSGLLVNFRHSCVPSRAHLALASSSQMFQNCKLMRHFLTLLPSPRQAPLQLP